MVKFEKVTYMGLKDSIKMYNENVELIIPTQLGFRVLSYRLISGENLFKSFDAQISQKDKNEWQSFGGHRLWHAPEVFPRTYEIDGGALEGYEIAGNSLKLLQRIDPVSKIKKEITVTLAEKSTEVILEHKITNMNSWEVEVAAWGLTVLEGGGFCAIKTPKNDFTLLSDRSVTLWPYSRMNDDRVYWGDEVISLRHAVKDNPFKFGMFAQQGKAVYVTGKTVFTKEFGCDKGALYPDRNCNFESYTNKDMLECESLSLLKKLSFRESLTHTEKWNLSLMQKEIAFNDEKEILKLL